MILKYLCELGRLTFDADNLIAKIVSWVMAMVVIIASVSSYQSDAKDSAEFYISFAFLGASLSYFIFVAPYKAWKKQFRIIEANQGTDSDLQFLPMQTYSEQKTPSKEREVLPVKITNKSNTETVEAVRVKVVRVKTDNKIYERNIDLISENTGDSSIAIDPNDSEVFRFGRCNPAGNLSGVSLAPEFGNSANRQGKYHLQNGVHEVELRATGKNTKPRSAIYTLKLEPGKTPEFYETPGKIT